MGAVDVLQPDICYLGGITRTMRVAELAKRYEMACTPHSANLSLVTTFTLHLMGAIEAAFQATLATAMVRPFLDDPEADPRIYATFLLWLMSELFEELPEVGDPDKPRLVFFFDEAHLLFDDAPAALMQKIEQVVRLIRSKGVGVYFVTQNPRDLPESVLAQLGNRLQHALRAYTPAERKGVRAAAQSFRENETFDTEEVITQLGVGEALVSTLDAKGAPSVVQWTVIRPPASRLGPATDAERKSVQNASPVAGKYEKSIDRESAYEVLEAREVKAAKEAEELAKKEAKAQAELDKKKKKTTTRRSSRRMSSLEKAGNQAARTASREIVRYILRGIMGTFKR